MRRRHIAAFCSLSALWLATGAAVAFVAVSARAQEADSEAASQSGASAGAAANIINTAPADVNLYNVPNISGPGLTAGITDCVGSTSGGVGWAGFGLSMGRTRRMEDCERRNDAIIMGKMGRDDVSLAIMCQSERVRRAMLAAGTPCLIDRDHQLVTLRGAEE